MIPAPPAPPHDCGACPRLVSYRSANRAANPGWFNGPVPGFGPLDAWLLIVGMAPGVKGANRTGRPFTGDHAGMLLYETLLQHGLAHGRYGADPADGMVLHGARVVNAVRCVPPENKVVPAEIATCNGYLKTEITGLPRLRTILALGLVAHQAVLRAHDMAMSRLKFVHGAQHSLPGGLILADSYHCSRYNTNTGRLTEAMFHAVFEQVRKALD